MVKFAATSLALALSLSTTSAFTSTPVTPYTQRTALKAVETPLAPLTQWGSPIPNILSSQEEMKSKPLEFAPTISASDLGLTGNAAEQLEYVRANKNDIKQRMVDCGAGEDSM